ncbi:hypothetical protein [Campylobacter iguaniorum]|nr:hypothetical protein [Campylobacter iguaniorum]
MMNNTPNKGFKMAIPFIAGVALGGLAIYAFNNRKIIKDKLICGFQKGKDVAVKTLNSQNQDAKTEPKKRATRAKKQPPKPETITDAK